VLGQGAALIETPVYDSWDCGRIIFSMLSPIRTGAVPFDQSVDSTSLPVHLAGCLRSVDASTVEILGNHVAFTAGIFRLVVNWNVLVPFGSGDLTVDSIACEVRYTLNCWQLVVMAIAMTGFMAAFSLLSGGNQMLWFLPFVWLWLVGGNLAIGIPRFRSFIVRAVATAPRRMAG
jgi:hypothetical protein